MVIFYEVPIFIVLLLFLVFADSTITLITYVFPILKIIFIGKNLIQDIYYGTVKNKNSILSSTAFFVVDSIRVVIFFRILARAAYRYASSGGLSYFLSMIDFIVVFLVAGFIFLVGEGVALVNGSANRKNTTMIVHIFVILLLVGFSFWGYGTL